MDGFSRKGRLVVDNIFLLENDVALMSIVIPGRTGDFLAPRGKLLSAGSPGGVLPVLAIVAKRLEAHCWVAVARIVDWAPR